MMKKDWVSIHIFYASKPNPLIIECIVPLINNLRERSLIQRYFFIKYWQEGPHVRLRLLPTEGVEQEEVKQAAESVIHAYLKHRPALYSVENDGAKSFYKEMFIAEYGKDNWIEKYGEDGEMPLHPNNSLHYIEYEPEYSRYGGIDGIEVAEWHFEKSSEIVTRLIRDTNIHVRSILLGLSIQLSLPLCYEFLEEDQKVINFFTKYMKHWQDSYHKEEIDLIPGFEKKFSKMASNLERRISEIRSYVLESSPGSLTTLEREWVAHIRELRYRIDDLITSKKLFFQNKDKEPFIVDDPLVAYNILLSSYIHMTNNRLGVLILDEIYLSYILRRSLEERMHAVQEIIP